MPNKPYLKNYADEHGMVKLYHYAHPSVGDAETIHVDPNKFHDKSVHGSYTANDRAAESSPKSFFYNDPETDKEHNLFAGRNLYVAKVHHKDVYDVESDPQNHAAHARGDISHLIQKVKDAGHKGMRYTHGGIDTTVLFHPVKAERTTEEHEFGHKIEDKTWKPDLESGESMLDQMEKVKREKWPELYKLSASQAPKGGAIVNGRMVAGGQVTEKPKSPAQRFRNVARILAGIKKVTNREEKAQPVKLAGKAPKKPLSDAALRDIKAHRKAARDAAEDTQGQEETHVHEYLKKLAAGDPSAHGTGIHSLLQAHGINTARAMTRAELERVEKLYGIPEHEKISTLPGVQALRHHQHLDEIPLDKRPSIDHGVSFITRMAERHLSAHGIDKIVKSKKLSPETRATFLQAQFTHELQKHTKDLSQHHTLDKQMHPEEWYTKGIDPLHVALHHAHADHEDDPMWGKKDLHHPEGPRVHDGHVWPVVHALIGMTSAQRNPVDNAVTTDRLISQGYREAAKHGSKNFIEHLPIAQHETLAKWKEKNAEHVANYPKGKGGKPPTAEQILKWRQSLPASATKQGSVGYTSAPAVVHPHTGKVLGFKKVDKTGKGEIHPVSKAADAEHKRLLASQDPKDKPKIVQQYPITDAKGQLRPKAWTTANDAFKGNISKLQKIQKHVQAHHMEPKSSPKYSDPSHPEYKPHGYDEDSIKHTSKWLLDHHEPEEIEKAMGVKGERALPNKGGYSKGDKKFEGASVFGSKMRSFILNMSGRAHHVTHDVWQKRLENMATGHHTKAQSPTEAERKPTLDALTSIAHAKHKEPIAPAHPDREIPHSPAATQAHLWAIAQGAAKHLGVDTESKNFIDGANAIEKEHGHTMEYRPNGTIAGADHKIPKGSGRAGLARPEREHPEKLAARQTGVIKHKHLVYVSANDRDTHTTFKDVPAIKRGPGHKLLTEAAKAMPGVTHVEQAVGSWSDGQEPTIVANVHGGADTKDLHHIGATLGLRHGDEGKNQKAFVAFEHGKADDPDRIHHLVVKGKKLPEIHKQLQAHGIEYQTMVPLSGRGENARTRVDILDRGHTLGDKVKAYQAHPDSGVEHSQSHPGLVHYVGPPEDGKGTREEGAAAMRPHVRPDPAAKVHLAAKPGADLQHRTGDAWVTPEANVEPVDHTVEHHGTAAKRLGYGHGKSAGEATTEMINKGGVRLRAGVGQIKDELLAESNQVPEIGGRKHKAIVAHALKHPHINRVVWYPRNGAGAEREIWNRQTHSESGE